MTFDHVAIALRHWLQSNNIPPGAVAVTLRPAGVEAEGRLTWALERDFRLSTSPRPREVYPSEAAKVAGIEFRIEPAPRPLRATIGGILG